MLSAIFEIFGAVHTALNSFGTGFYVAGYLIIPLFILYQKTILYSYYLTIFKTGLPRFARNDINRHNTSCVIASEAR